ncbi:cytochrome d ubiquinol oxidase subunit II [Spiractinospora alimapuensis]|uniref:cytochrome d ubiquinol oxidase subunit II n=1 Tax=Spiractinospora alimapuensis TaxID=2820884 RepID=UPI001F2B3693|nr:cytochrome d ubiquinol oxidase subunit II [Spiractinospora alimapuensis]QVQ53669.1 cytochrome d ubiquinol oxidase subunit II [Spiractinospora alimapuensis]
MNTLAITVLAVLLLGYFTLAARDVGLGMLLPVVARHPADRRRAFAAMAPYFLGTEVWLVAAIGVVAGVFPILKGELLAWSWPLLIALAVSWLVRDAGLWFWALTQHPRPRGAWAGAVALGSWGLAGTWGLVLGGILTGGTTVSVAGALVAGCVVVLFALSGAAFGAERLVASGADAAHSPAADLAGEATRWLSRGGVALVALAAVGTALLSRETVERPLVATVLLAVVVVCLAMTAGTNGPRWSAHSSALAMAAAIALVVTAVNLPGLVADPASMRLVGFAVAPVVPLMVVGQLWLYRALRRPVTTGGYFA